MSCVIAVKDIKTEKIFMGADSQCILDENSKLYLPDDELKILDFNKFTIGITGDFVMNNIIQEIDIDTILKSPLKLLQFGAIKKYLELLDLSPTFELLIVDKIENTLYTLDSSFSLTKACYTVDNRYMIYTIGSGHIDARAYLAGRLENNNITEEVIYDCLNYVSQVNTTVSNGIVTYTL